MNVDRINNDQLDLLNRPPAGKRRKERALSDHDRHKVAAIRWLRMKLAELYRERLSANAGWSLENCWVSADDARVIYERSLFPKEYAQNRTFFGSIFRGAEWEVVGRTASRHPANNAREIKTWRFIG